MWHLSSYKSVLASLDFSRSPKSSQRQRWTRNQTEKAKRLSVDWLMCFSLRHLRRLRAYSPSSPGHSYLFECFTFLGLWQPQAHLYRCYPSPPFPDCSAVFSNTLLLSLPDGILFAHFGFYGKKQTAIPYSSATAVKMEAFCDIKKHMLCSAQAAQSTLHWAPAGVLKSSSILMLSLCRHGPTPSDFTTHLLSIHNNWYFWLLTVSNVNLLLNRED